MTDEVRSTILTVDFAIIYSS